MSYQCPLCKQEVSKSLFEEITGIWKAREKSLQTLKLKEEKLKEKELKFREKETDLLKKYQRDKKAIIEKKDEEVRNLVEKQKKIHTSVLQKARETIDKERRNIQNEFQRRLAQETNKAMKKANVDLKSKLKILKEDIVRSAEYRFVKEKDKINKEKEKIKKGEKLAQDRNIKLLTQFKTLQLKSKVDISKRDRKILSLEEQLKKNQTPQVLGLLEEGVFLNKLKVTYPTDSFEHPGKIGDILHYINVKGHVAGKIIYELKKVASFQTAYITQTYEAKQKREADYGILIINAKRSKDDSGFSISKGVLIVHPAGALVLINILRENLIKIHEMKLGKEEKDQAIKAVIEYIQSPAFSNSIESVIKDTIDLYESWKKEIKEHFKIWQFRFDRYSNINAKAKIVDGKILTLLSGKQTEQRKLLSEQKLKPIDLPILVD